MKLQQKLKMGKCPNCGYTGNKHVSPNLYHLISIDVENNAGIIGGKTPYEPLLAAHCPECGYEMLFNLLALDILKK